jgi:chromosome segregation ATPase
MKGDSDTNELEEQLTEAYAQIETLQASAADAEARATTARAELKAAAEAQAEVIARLESAEAERDAAQGRIAEREAAGDGLRGQLREAAVKYRAARLAAAPDVPQDLVPELETIEEIDREFESAVRVVGQLREKLEREAAEQKPRGRVPVGAPARRQQDLSSLSPGEKIRIGLQRLDAGG